MPVSASWIPRSLYYLNSYEYPYTSELDTMLLEILDSMVDTIFQPPFFFRLISINDLIKIENTRDGVNEEVPHKRKVPT